ncbi:MAG: integration host factor subunit beta [Candidatus Methylumidiphilus alinenensis]|uniref:Integration host factor subunit beta n=1 Tax=Candidatus Methylumidiphilus alinenensis TaxID=2202197 RepID=A0A2W4SYL9_9GAMM|nr:MAG: integration host factor subunit beta [Candidatus Methylumidiphilus alinenensis]
MTRAELISRLADKLGHLPVGEVKAAVLAITDRIVLALQSGDRVEIRGFGGFSLHRRPPRVDRNPRTGEAVELPARFAVHFKPGKELRERVNAARD